MHACFGIASHTMAFCNRYSDKALTGHQLDIPRLFQRIVGMVPILDPAFNIQVHHVTCHCFDGDEEATIISSVSQFVTYGCGGTE